MHKIATIVGLVAIALPGFAADQLRLKDGRSYNGQFISGSTTQVVFEDENGTRRRFQVREVDSLTFDASANSAFGTSSTRSTQTADSDRRAPYGNERIGSSDRYANTTNRTRSAADRAVIIPEGSEIQVRVNEEVDSRTAAEGRSYSAEIYRDIVDQNGSVLITRGSNAELVIREMKQGGTTGSPQLVLDLQSVVVNGQRYLVSTTDVGQSNREGIGANRRTAEMVGGGAALGTLLGAIAGGGKGAAIGAIAGAAAGGAVQVITKGDQVRVPAETILTFDLDQPLRLETAR
jgi:hypothetical protein